MELPMTKATPTPLPDHGSEWGLAFLLLDLYGLVALVGVGTVVAFALTRFDRSVPPVVQYLFGGLLVASLGLAGFITLVAAAAGRFDLVGLLALAVYLPPLLVVRRRRGSTGGHLRALTAAGMAWSLPFLLGFGVLGAVGSVARGVPPALAGVAGVVIVVVGTLAVDSLDLIQAIEGREPRPATRLPENDSE